MLAFLCWELSLIVKVMFVPTLTLDFNDIFPSKLSTSFFEIARPRPVPFELRLLWCFLIVPNNVNSFGISFLFPIYFIIVNSNTCIDYFKLQLSNSFKQVIVKHLLHWNMKSDSALQCELESVRNQVVEHLLDAANVRSKRFVKHSAVGLDSEVNAFLRALEREHVLDVLHQRPDAEGLLVEREGACFDLGEVEDVFDQTHQTGRRDLADS